MMKKKFLQEVVEFWKFLKQKVVDVNFTRVKKVIIFMSQAYLKSYWRQAVSETEITREEQVY